MREFISCFCVCVLRNDAMLTTCNNRFTHCCSTATVCVINDMIIPIPLCIECDVVVIPPTPFASNPAIPTSFASILVHAPITKHMVITTIIKFAVSWIKQNKRFTINNVVRIYTSISAVWVICDMIGVCRPLCM